VAASASHKRETRVSSFILALALITGLGLISIACRTVSPVVLPPGEILSFRGQGSFYFQSPGEKGRVRLNFSLSCVRGSSGNTEPAGWLRVYCVVK